MRLLRISSVGYNSIVRIMRSSRALAACLLVLYVCLPAMGFSSPSVAITAPVEGQLVQTPFLNITFGEMNHQSHINTLPQPHPELSVS